MKLSVSSTIGVGTPSTVEANEMDTVRMVRDKVAASQAIDPEAVSLMHKGEVLPLEKTVKAVGLREGDSLKAMPANPVGGSSTFSSHVTRSRIANEAARVQAAGIDLKPVSPFEWVGRVKGGASWAGRTFEYRIRLQPDHPARPPIVQFTTPFEPRHPNVSPDGHVCLNHLMASWSPCITLVAIHDELEWLIAHPSYKNGFFGGDPAPLPVTVNDWLRRFRIVRS